jgi:hypothetical protein
MGSLVWDEELTRLALRNQRHQAWAVVSTSDMARALEAIELRGGSVPAELQAAIKEQIGTQHDDFMDALIGLGFVRRYENQEGQNSLTLTSAAPWRGAFTGHHVARLIAEDGLNSVDARNAMGHNFILLARESLEFCAALIVPGMTKAALEAQFINRIVFNNKLNKFKFDNLLGLLEQFGVLEREEAVYRISYSPAPLTFYCMAERYLLDASYEVGAKVDVSALARHLDRLLPSGARRSENADALQLPRSPFEGWGRHRTWLTPEGFGSLLGLGLIHPRSVARILRRQQERGTGDVGTYAEQALTQLRRHFEVECRAFRGEIAGLDEYLSEYGCTSPQAELPGLPDTER